ncbi:MAG: DUF4147 domain-containing protein, partial [Gallionella sp.]|nr:DUF4147 domain-containing protein [Gallionella sp.]
MPRTNELARAGVADAATLVSAFAAALHAADARTAVLGALCVEAGCLRAGGKKYDLAAFERIVVVGAGKAAAAMAQAVESRLGARISDGLIVVKQ